MSDDPDLAADDPRRSGAEELLGAGGQVVVIAARDEAQRIGGTITAISTALPGARLIVADDGSIDDTARIAREAGAEVVSAGTSRGKGANMTSVAAGLVAPPTGAESADGGSALTVLLCDGDLGPSASELSLLVGAVERGECDLA